MCVYVDDMLILAEAGQARDEFMKVLTSLWAFGPERVLSPTTSLTFLGLDFKMNKQGDVILDQERFTKELLEKYGMLHCNSLMSINMDKPPVDPDPPSAQELQDLQAFAGNFNWLATRTRPDLSYFTSLLSSSSTHQGKWSKELATKMLRYLAGSREQGIVLTAAGDEKDLKVYTDAGFAGASTKSQNGLVVLWGGSIVTWRSSRASLSALSTAEAELCSAALGWQVTEGIRYMLASLGVVVPSTTVLIDNSAALTAAQLGATWRTRYYAVRAQRLLEEGRRGTATLLYCPTLEMVADALTKLASKEVLAVFRDVMNSILPKTARANRTSVDPGPQNSGDEAGDGPQQWPDSSGGIPFDKPDAVKPRKVITPRAGSSGGGRRASAYESPMIREVIASWSEEPQIPKEEEPARTPEPSPSADWSPINTASESEENAKTEGLLEAEAAVGGLEAVDGEEEIPGLEEAMIVHSIKASLAGSCSGPTAVPDRPKRPLPQPGPPKEELATEVEEEPPPKHKKRRGKPRCRPGANERRWAKLDAQLAASQAGGSM